MTDENVDILDGDMEKQPVKRRQRRQLTAQETVQRNTAATPKRVRIVVEENDAIPPTGLPLQHNGRAIVIKPGEVVEIPEPYLEILDHAVMSVAQVDPQTQQVVGYRDRLRYPYRRV